MIKKILPMVTVYSGRATVNPMEAAPQVIAALPGMQPANLAGVLATRSRPDATNADIADALPSEAKAFVSPTAANALRVRIQGRSKTGARTEGEAVFLLIDDTEPYWVLSWNDEDN